MQAHSKNRLKPVAGASGRAAEIAMPEGPPDIQTQAILGTDGAIIREATVVKAHWRDPEDTAAHLRREGARTIHGFRRVWTILSLHTAGPREITEQHIKAACLLLDDYQRSLGVACGRDVTSSPVDNGGQDMGPNDLCIQAAERYEAAMEAMGLEGALLVFHIVVVNMSINKLAAQWGMHRDRMHGRLCAAMSRLAEHYWPPTRSRSVASHMPIMEIVDGLPVERFGRWKETTP